MGSEPYMSTEDTLRMIRAQHDKIAGIVDPHGDQPNVATLLIRILDPPPLLPGVPENKERHVTEGLDPKTRRQLVVILRFMEKQTHHTTTQLLITLGLTPTDAMIRQALFVFNALQTAWIGFRRGGIEGIEAAAKHAVQTKFNAVADKIYYQITSDPNKGMTEEDLLYAFRNVKLPVGVLDIRGLLDQDLRALYDAADTNDDKVITNEEWQAMFEKLRKLIAEKALHELGLDTTNVYFLITMVVLILIIGFLFVILGTEAFGAGTVYSSVVSGGIPVIAGRFAFMYSRGDAENRERTANDTVSKALAQLTEGPTR